MAAAPFRSRVARLGPVLILLLALVLPLVGAVGGSVRDAAAQSMTFDAWMPLAEAGDPEAQCQVGVAYLNGNQVAQDFQRGMAWLIRSSDAGYGYARFVLADVYSRGYAGVPVNDEKAYYYASLAVASSTLLEKYRDRAVKIRDASAKHLTAAQVSRLQAMAVQAPRDAATSGS